MPILRLTTLTLLALLFGSQSALAFSVETTSSTNSDGSSRYADPEEQLQAKFGLSSDASTGQSDANGTSGVRFNMNAPDNSAPAAFIQPYGADHR